MQMSVDGFEFKFTQACNPSDSCQYQTDWCERARALSVTQAKDRINRPGPALYDRGTVFFYLRLSSFGERVPNVVRVKDEKCRLRILLLKNR